MATAQTPSVNRLPLVAKVKKLRDAVALRNITPYSSAAEGLETHEVEHEGQIVGTVVSQGGNTIAQQSSADMQVSGIDEKASAKGGGKKTDVIRTVASKVAEQADDSPQVKPASDSSPVTVPKHFESKKVDLSPGDTKSTERASEPKGGKPDRSLFKPATKTSPDIKPAEGDFKADKASLDAKSQSSGKEAKAGKPDKSMSKMASEKRAETEGSDSLKKGVGGPQYDIRRENDTLVYTRSAPKPQEPRWKRNWQTKPADEQDAIARKLRMARLQNQNAKAIDKSLEDSYKIENQAELGDQSNWRRMFSALRKSETLTKARPQRRPISNIQKTVDEMKPRRMRPGRFHKTLRKMFMLRKSLPEGTSDAPSHSIVEKLEKLRSLQKAGAPNIAPAQAAAPKPKLPEPVKPAKMSKMDEKKLQLLQMARTGKPKPDTSTPLGHAYANYTDPNSFSFDPKFQALVKQANPAWAEA